MQAQRWCPLMGLIALAATGCSSSPAVPSIPAWSNPLNQAAGSAGLSSSIAGSFQIDIDVDTLSATVTPLTREGQAIGDLFYLNVAQFGVVVAPRPVNTLTNLDLVNNTIDFNYQVAHSFPAPSNPGGNATAANRADLGISGRVMFLVDAPVGAIGDNDYEFNFTFGPVIMNTKAILNADGYYNPGDMLNGYHTQNINGTSAWPFKMLVDENLDPRTNTATGNPISNGGQQAGNYPANNWSAVSEWTGGPNVTGHGVLHQGQTAWNFVTLNIAPGNQFSLKAVVIANYTDPRGGANAAERRANRLPKDDPSRFAYRMPHGALDLEKTTFVAMGLPGVLSATGPAAVFVRDPDFSSTLGFGLDEIPNSSKIQTAEVVSGELGLALSLSLPPSGSGTMADPLAWNPFTLTNVSGTNGGSDGVAFACVMLEDEQSANDSGITLNNASPPVPSSFWQQTIVYQVCRVPIF